jgi:hypothetical protein
VCCRDFPELAPRTRYDRKGKTTGRVLNPKRPPRPCS